MESIASMLRAIIPGDSLLRLMNIGRPRAKQVVILDPIATCQGIGIVTPNLMKKAREVVNILKQQNPTTSKHTNLKTKSLDDPTTDIHEESSGCVLIA
ncbi:hypothetical protein K435DRAFT_858384 [Dendrothele bispora CBS 962.96]|uniref:Uncharacterized protein n=1 Tax=Dendrothele bispora (strain CBS 962.96) TaxID=1314807 RepID=A0A4S8M4F1_DENBC|nr:hypothetical protein K435DRAFT_858384 [Dendrothele bispora CBS 962.96]